MHIMRETEISCTHFTYLLKLMYIFAKIAETKTQNYMLMKKIVCLLCVCCCCSVAGWAQLRVASLIGDNMILQQQADARLWGWAPAQSHVRVTPSWSDEAVSVKADDDGRWELTVQTPQASFVPYTIDITAANDSIEISNVLVGEVWFASGQSNMEMPLKGFGGCCVKEGIQEAIEARNYPHVRMFTVPLRQSYTPQPTCEGQWAMPTFENAMKMSATAWFFAKNMSQVLNVPVGIVNCSYGGSTVESWLPAEILQQYPDVSLKREDIEKAVPWERQLLMYNGMFVAAHRYTVKGIIWYQGCSNVGRHQTYAERLATMVDHWRGQMQLGDIPFYYVEIAPYDYDSPSQDGKAAYLREAQYKAQKLITNSAMVSTNDLVESYERFNIHPRRKAEVGWRLSYVALHKTYGMTDICCQGPTYNGDFSVEDGEAYVGFDNLQMGICRNYELKGFEVAGADKVFYPADSVWIKWQTNHAVVSSKKVPQPVAVRYCFGDFMPGTLIGGNELPAVPFRTDEW